MIQALSGMLALSLFGTGVVVLQYGIRLLTDVFQQAVNIRVQRSLHHVARHPFLAFGLGICTTALLQSSNAMASLLVSLVNAGLLPLAVAVVLLLGANVGSTFVVQFLAWHLTTNAPLFIGLGTLAVLWTRGTSLRSVGQICFAFGLIMLSLDLISQGSQPILTNPLIALLLRTQEGDTVMLLLIGAILAAIASSSAASISVILSFATTGAVLPAAALAIMAGATLAVLLSAFHGGTVSERRLALIHTGIRLLGASVMLSILSPLTNLLTSLWPNPATQVAMIHLLLNSSLALLFVPLAPWLARLMSWLLPVPSSAPGKYTDLRYLDQQVLAIPSLILGLAMRAVLRMAEVTEMMLEQSMDAFEEDAGTFQATIERHEERLDELHHAVKHYLSCLDETLLSPRQLCWEMTLFSLATDLEAIANVLARRCMDVAQRKQRDGFLFSEEGREDLQRSYKEVLKAFHWMQAAMVDWNGDLTNEFLLTKQTYSHATALFVCDIYSSCVQEIHSASRPVVFIWTFWMS